MHVKSFPSLAIFYVFLAGTFPPLSTICIEFSWKILGKWTKAEAENFPSTWKEGCALVSSWKFLCRSVKMTFHIFPFSSDFPAEKLFAANHKRKSISRKGEAFKVFLTRSSVCRHSVSSSILKTFLSVAVAQGLNMQEFPLKISSLPLTFGECGRVAHGGKIFHVPSTFLVVLLILFSRIFVLLLKAIKHDEFSSCGSFFSLKKGNFVSVVFQPLRPRIVLLLFYFPRVFFIVVLLCFPFLSLRSDTTKNLWIKKNLRLASSPQLQKAVIRGRVSRRRLLAFVWFFFFGWENWNIEKLHFGFLVGGGNTSALDVHMWWCRRCTFGQCEND